MGIVFGMCFIYSICLVFCIFFILLMLPISLQTFKTSEDPNFRNKFGVTKTKFHPI